MASNPFRTGVFILSGLILLLATLFFLGLSDLFIQKVKFVTLVRESVQGLDVGSTVRYRGVPVGNVSAISIQTQDKLIRIEMEIRVQPFVGTQKIFNGGQDAQNEFRKFFNAELSNKKNPLRLRLNYAGITGLKYVELDYFGTETEKELIPRPNDLPSEVFYVYALPSVFTDMLKSLTVSMDKVSRIPFGDIAEQMQHTLKQFNEILKEKGIGTSIDNMAGITRELKKSVAAFAKVCDEQNMQHLRETAMQTMAAISQASLQMKQSVAEAKVGETAEELRKIAASADSAVAKLERTLDALSMLLDYLNRDPAALLRGKNSKTVDPGTLH